MLAASTTGAIILGIVILLVVLGLLYLAVRLLWRVVTWPFRASRRKLPTGAGADYEAMIRQQSRVRPARYERPLPFPPPSGQRSPSAVPAVESQIVLPPPPYRSRQPEAPEPASSAVTPDRDEPSRWVRLMRTPVRIPPWLTVSFAWLGLVFVAFKPLGLMDWVGYGVALVFAVVIAVYTRAHYHSTILWKGERQGVVWVRWGKADDGASPPVVVTPVSENLPDATETPDAAPVTAP